LGGQSRYYGANATKRSGSRFTYFLSTPLILLNTAHAKSARIRFALRVRGYSGLAASTEPHGYGLGRFSINPVNWER
jgi:hypothetical protein